MQALPKARAKAMTDQEDKIINAMARAMCVAEGRDPEGATDMKCEMWKIYRFDARRHRAAYLAMKAAEASRTENVND